MGNVKVVYENPILQLSRVKQSTPCITLFNKKKKIIIPSLQLSLHLLVCVFFPSTSLIYLFFLHYPKASLAQLHQDVPLASHSSGVHFLERANLMKLPLLLVP